MKPLDRIKNMFFNKSTKESAMSLTVGSLPRIIGNSTVTVTDLSTGKTYTADDSHINFERIVETLKDTNSPAEDLINLFDIPKAVHQVSSGNITIENGTTIKYKGREMHNSLTRRMIDMLTKGFDVSALTMFLENLMLNPSNRSIEQLYSFLERNELPITGDGHFLAYKKVREDYLDFHSGRFDNSPGKIVEVPRNEVDDDFDNTCSYGLHFCSLGYLAQYHTAAGRCVIVKINPKDVVAFPTDHGFTKGRTSRYEVVGDHKGGEKTEAFHHPVHDEFDDPEDDNDENDSNFCTECGHYHG